MLAVASAPGRSCCGTPSRASVAAPLLLIAVVEDRSNVVQLLVAKTHELRHEQYDGVRQKVTLLCEPPDDVTRTVDVARHSVDDEVRESDHVAAVLLAEFR